MEGFVNIDIKVDDEQVRNLVNRISSIGVKTIQWFENVAAPRVRMTVKENFDQEGRPSWKPLARSTERARKSGRNRGLWNVGDAHPILQRTGDLMKMVLGTKEKIEGSNTDVTMIFDPSQEGFKFGGSAHGGAHSYLFHQLGGNKIPQRQMVGLQEEDIQWLTNRYQDFVESSLQGI